VPSCSTWTDGWTDMMKLIADCGNRQTHLKTGRRETDSEDYTGTEHDPVAARQLNFVFHSFG
jgi:hypothetical protein